MERVINLTPHAINLIAGGQTITFEPSGIIARIEKKEMPKGTINIGGVSIPLVKHQVLEVLGVPQDYNNDTIYIVSAMVMEAYEGENWLIAPDTNRAIRNEQGHIIGVPGFVTK